MRIQLKLRVSYTISVKPKGEKRLYETLTNCVIVLSIKLKNKNFKKRTVHIV